MARLRRPLDDREPPTPHAPSRVDLAVSNSIRGLDVHRLPPREIAALQRSTGNAAVASLFLQRDDHAPPVPGPVQTPAPATPPQPDPAQDAKDLLAEKLATSKDYAGWLLEARDKSLVEFTKHLPNDPQGPDEKIK